MSQSKAGAASDYVRGEDVLDIWFDSGASWAAVLEGTFEVSSVCPVMQIIFFVKTSPRTLKMIVSEQQNTPVTEGFQVPLIKPPVISFISDKAT